MAFPRLAGLFLLPLAAFAAEPKLAIKPDRTDGIYQPGQTVTWTVDIAGERPADADFAAVPYTVKENDAVELAHGTIDLSAGPATVSATCNEPATAYLEIRPDKSKPLPWGAGGAVFAPEKLGPAMPPPADFDAFWGAKLTELDAIPPDPVVEKEEGLPKSEGLVSEKVSLANIWNTRVRGRVARPEKGDKFPAMLIFQSAGVGPLDPQQALGNARPGWLVFSVLAHDLPIDAPPEFYKDQSDHALNRYIYLGSEDRETTYFLRMLLGCVRAAEYLASRPDWDGKTLVVTGTSQGGFQSFATAALFPQVTALMVDVPAGCDVKAPLATPPRAFGWPYWISNWGGPRDMKKVEQACGYYDAIYFAQRAKCPGLVAAALLDVAARPAGVIAAANALPGPKELIVMPLSDHYGTGGAQAAFFDRATAWKTALLRGQPPPIAAAAP